VKFRSKIFLAIILPSSALVAAVVGAGLARVTRDNEERAQHQLSSTRTAFEATLLEQLEQLKTLSAPFKGPRFDAAISEAVASGDIAGVRQQLEYQFQLLGRTPDFYELRDRSGKILLRKSHDEKSSAGPVQKWVAEREEALTEFDGRPYLAIRFDHEKGTLVIGTQVTNTLENLKRSFGIDLALVGKSGPVYLSLKDWKPSMGLDGTVYVGKTRYLAQQGAPNYSELTPVLFMANMSPIDEARVDALALGAGGVAVACLVALLVSILVSRGMSRPIESLVVASHKIAAGDYKVKVEVGTRDEIGRLAAAFNDMTEGLRKRQEIMDKTLSRDVAEEFLKGTDRRPDRRVVTIVFMDIRGYTSGTEGMDPGDVVVMLNELMDLLSSAIVRNGGIVNKFLGDGLMAMFGAPKPLEGHALKAVRAGLEMQKWMARWNDRRIARGMPAFFSGIGINTGYAMCGKVGAQDRMEYTLIGEEVNLASRICGKAAPKQVLVTKQTWDLVQGEMKGRELEPVTVKGLSYPIKVYEVLE
jgi:class 3 adenylate cyclase